MKRPQPGKYVPSCGICVLLVLLALLGAKEAAASGRLLGSPLSPLQGIVSADLNGDRQSDTATAGAGRRDSRGYLQDITVSLGSAEFHTLTVRTALRVHRLSARDLDGDADRDLVLESFDREPLAVLLNDGAGHFQLGNLDSFRTRLPRRRTLSLESPAEELLTLEIGQGPGSPTAGPAITGYRHTPCQRPRLRHRQAPRLCGLLFSHFRPRPSCFPQLTDNTSGGL